MRRRWGLALVLALGCGDSSETDSTTSTTSSTGGAGAGGASGGAPSGGGMAATGGGGSSSAGCPTCGDIVDLSTPKSAGLVEASGLAASGVHPGVFWAHNDSGDSARLFAFGEDGAARGNYDVAGLDPVDWEDMSRGPCADPAKSCLYIGDIGDNGRSRSTYTLVRVEEPAALAPGGATLTPEVFTFQYPDGSHNAEALMVHPQTGVVYIATKSARATRVYAFPTPLSASQTMTLEDVGQATVPDLLALVTGGDIHPAGDGVLLRTYSTVWYYPIARGQAVGAALAGTPCALPTPVEGQGETVAFTLTGDGYRTLSEGAGEVLHGVSCR